jgi:hypothetical protein
MRRSRKDELDEENRDEGEGDACDENLNGERAGEDWTIGEVRVGRIATGRTQVSVRKVVWGIRRTHCEREKVWLSVESSSFLGNLIYPAWPSWPAPNSNNLVFSLQIPGQSSSLNLTLTKANGFCIQSTLGCLSIVQVTPTASFPRSLLTPSLR